ncbi:MAG: beta-galactosidase [Deinococcus sp.]|nr:beta-galactosidase [Deinococcus sp.]
MMPPVTLRRRRLYVGDQAVPLFSGEVHYWRLAPEYWRAALEQVRGLGLKVVGTYVPWAYHEYARGSYDFHGLTSPQRNLVGFLNLLTDMGFWIIIRPGPYLYGEWENGGVPAYAARHHRLSTSFQRLARTWMEQVTPVLLPYLATRGGRIVLWQPDNEIDPFSCWFEREQGLDDVPGLFHQFLQERYQSIAELNAAWGTHYTKFAEARAWAESPFTLERGCFARVLDWWRFQHWSVVQYGRWCANQYRGLGVDVPLYLNYYPGMDVQNWREMAKVVDLVAIDTYPANEFSNSPDAHRIFLDTLRYQRSVSPLPFIGEFECGIFHGYHQQTGVLSANHYRLMACSALLAGIAGWNWYMLVNRDNWYFSPIHERGRPHPELYGTFQQIVQVVKKLSPPDLEKLTDTALTLEPLHVAASGTIRTDPVLAAAYSAGLDYDFFDPGNGQVPRRLLFYSGAQWLDQAGQQRLLEHVVKGGILVVFKNYPRLDGAGQPLNLLNIPLPDGVLTKLAKRVAIDLGGMHVICAGALLVYDHPPGTAITAVQEQDPDGEPDQWPQLYAGRRHTVGYIQRWGQGTLVVLGVDPTPDLLIALHHHCNVPIYARSLTPGVQAALFRRGRRYFLIAVNNGNESKYAVVRLDPTLFRQRSCRLVDLWEGTTSSALLPDVAVPLSRKSGGVWEIQATKPSTRHPPGAYGR